MKPSKRHRYGLPRRHPSRLAAASPSWVAVAVVALLALTLASPAHGKPPKKTTIAVLEYRAGVQSSANITDQVVKLLKKKTSYKVVDIDEAKQRLGSRIEGDVADCAGEAACMARVGRKLKVDEVLLVGLTRLGDVIVALSRILTKNSKVAGRVGMSLTEGVGLPTKKLLKSLKQLLPSQAFKRYGWIRVKSNETGATITIGKKVYGQTPLDRPLKMKAPANYTITVAKKGFMTFQANLQVPPDATITVNARLMPKGAGAGPPIYKKWWFWTALGGSVAAAIAGTVAGVLLWQNSKSQPAKVVVTW